MKNSIILELEDINKTNEKPNLESDPGRKFSDEYKIIEIPSHLETILSPHKEFDKHISNYCTVYLDFDSHSEEYNSYIVKIGINNINLGIQLARSWLIYS